MKRNLSGNEVRYILRSERIIRKVIQGDEDNLRLEALDTSLPPLDIARASILYLYKVVGCLHREQM